MKMSAAARSAGEEETHHSHHCRCDEKKMVINRFMYQSHITDWTAQVQKEILGVQYVGVYSVKSYHMM